MTTIRANNATRFITQTTRRVCRELPAFGVDAIERAAWLVAEGDADMLTLKAAADAAAAYAKTALALGDVKRAAAAGAAAHAALATRLLLAQRGGCRTVCRGMTQSAANHTEWSRLYAVSAESGVLPTKEQLLCGVTIEHSVADVRAGF